MQVTQLNGNAIKHGVSGRVAMRDRYTRPQSSVLSPQSSVRLVAALLSSGGAI